MRVCVSLPKGKLKGDRMKELEKFLNTSGELKPGFTNRDFNMKRELIAFLVGSANGFWVCLCLLLRALSLKLQRHPSRNLPRHLLRSPF